MLICIWELWEEGEDARFSERVTAEDERVQGSAAPFRTVPWGQGRTIGPPCPRSHSGSGRVWRSPGARPAARLGLCPAWAFGGVWVGVSGAQGASRESAGVPILLACLPACLPRCFLFC